MNNLEKKLQSILNKMDIIEYGFVEYAENIYPDNEEDFDETFQTKYFLQSPERLLETKHGVCWDQVELERYYLENNNIESKSYFIINYDGKIFPTHTFIIISNEEKYFWLEHSWEPYRGLHQFKTEKETLVDVKTKFNNMIKNKYNIDNNDTIIYEYKKPNYNIDANEFFKHCESGVKVLIEEE